MRKILVGVSTVLVILSTVLTGIGGASITPTQAQTSDCKGAPPTQLSVGVRAAVLPVSEGLPVVAVRLRSDAGLKGRILSELQSGAQMIVLSGPVCQDSYLWWQVQLDNGAQGWVAEGSAQNYFIDPIPSIVTHCADVPPTRFVVGARGQVRPARPGTTPNVARIRDTATTDGKILLNLPEKTSFTVIDGPVCFGGYLWWKVKVDQGVTGWLAEGDSTRGYYVFPIGFPAYARILPTSLVTPTPSVPVRLHNGFYDIAISKDGTLLAGTLIRGELRVWDIQSGTLIWGLPSTEQTALVAFAPNGTDLVTEGRYGRVTIWNIRTHVALLKFDEPAPQNLQFQVFQIAYSPDGTRLVTDNVNGIAHLYDSSTGKPLQTFTEAPRTTRAGIAFSRDGQQIVTAGSDFAATIWDTQTGAKVRRLANHTDYICGLDWSPDGKTIVTGSLDRTIKVWDAASGQVIRQFALTSPPTATNTLSISHDSKSVAAIHADQITRIWDLATGTEKIELIGQFEIATWIKFAPDDKTVFTAGFSSTTPQWDVATGKQIKVFTSG